MTIRRGRAWLWIELLRGSRARLVVSANTVLMTRRGRSSWWSSCSESSETVDDERWYHGDDVEVEVTVVPLAVENEQGIFNDV